MALARNLANGDAKTAINVTGTVAVAQGGTGLTAAPTNGQIDIGSTGVGFVRTTITQGSGISVTNSAGSITIANTSPSSGGTVTSVTGTSPVSVATGTTTPVISLAASYGDTQNPYASKTAKFILAAPNGAAGVPTFRAVVASDIPTLNQSTTGTAANVTGTVAIANGGTGATNSATARTNLGAQATLVSGSNIRTVNGNTLLGSTDIVITASAASDAISVITTNTTLVRYNTYVITATLTATLPITPAVGDWVVISNRSNVRTVTIARNGSNIMGLAENMTLDTINPAFKLTYANATQGWVLI